MKLILLPLAALFALGLSAAPAVAGDYNHDCGYDKWHECSSTTTSSSTSTSTSTSSTTSSTSTTLPPSESTTTTTTTPARTVDICESNGQCDHETTDTTQPPTSSTLPRTGTSSRDVTDPAIVGALLLVLGSGAVFWSRRKLAGVRRALEEEEN